MRYGSLFAGAGGVDLGFDAAGWECVWQVEIDPHARKVLDHHWPEVPIHDDITRCVGSPQLQLAGVGGEPLHGGDPHRRGGGADNVEGARHLLEPVDLIVGGFPCQDLSVAGKRGGMAEGTRSGLFYDFVRIVKEMRHATDGASPRWVVWENVAGLLSMPGTLGAVLAGWAEAGAVVQEWRTVDSGRAFGIPQRRRRVLGVACFDPRAESAGPVLADREGVRRDPAPGVEAGQGTAGGAANGVGAGGGPDDNAAQTNHLIPSHVGTITANWHKGAGNTQVEEGILVPFCKTHRANTADDHETWVPAEVVPTLSAEVSNNRTAITNQLGVRRLTPTECEALMGWPDGHTAPAGADSHRYRLAGNGVIAPAAHWVARRIDATEARW